MTMPPSQARERVAEVEGADVDGGGQGGRVRRLVEDPLLQRRHGRRSRRRRSGRW